MCAASATWNTISSGAERRLVFPWSKGLEVENILAYYDEIGFRDWTHRDTGAPAFKAQHPEFEMWSQGVHARSGVTCSDCHMPRIEYKGSNVSDHWVRSPIAQYQERLPRLPPEEGCQNHRTGPQRSSRRDPGPTLEAATGSDERSRRR